MRSGDRDVEGIGVCSGGQKVLSDDGSCQLLSFLGHLEKRDSLQHPKPSTGRLWIATPHLIHYKLRAAKVKVPPATLPPVQRDLLMSSRHQVSTGPGRKVAHYRSLDVDPCSHTEENITTNGRCGRSYCLIQAPIPIEKHFAEDQQESRRRSPAPRLLRSRATRNGYLVEQEAFHGEHWLEDVTPEVTIVKKLGLGNPPKKLATRSGHCGSSVPYWSARSNNTSTARLNAQLFIRLCPHKIFSRMPGPPHSPASSFYDAPCDLREIESTTDQQGTSWFSQRCSPCTRLSSM